MRDLVFIDRSFVKHSNLFILRANSWAPEWGPKKARWEPLPASQQKNTGQAAANARLFADLMEAIEQDRQPPSSRYGGRWSLEMIRAVCHSQRSGGRVGLPLKERRHPLRELTIA